MESHIPRQLIKLHQLTSLADSNESDTTFILETTLKDLVSNVDHFPQNGRTIIANTDQKALVTQVAALQRARPDLVIYGHCGNGVEAFRGVGTILKGQTAEVTRSLTAEDAAWISTKTNVSVPAGATISAPFVRKGGLDHKEFGKQLAANSTELIAKLNKELSLQDTSALPSNVKGEDSTSRINLTKLRQMLSLGSDTATAWPKNVHKELKSLGPVAVFGASGNIGGCILEALGGKVPVAYGICRKPDSTPLAHLGNAKKPVYGYDKLPESTAIKTAFITASIPWETDENGNIIFNRAALYEGNFKILKDTLKQIPTGTHVQIVTNPCSDLSFVAGLLRPDLKISAHGGTDVVRTQDFAKNPNDPKSYAVIGPHSPAMVAPDLERRELIEEIPTRGQVLSEESGGRSVTDPTGLASIVDEINIINRNPTSYAIPLSSEEAKQLTKFMTDIGKPIEIHEGMVPTLPHDAKGGIDWDMLKMASKIPNFAKTYDGFKELEKGRTIGLNAIINSVKEKHPEMDIDHNWVLENKGKLLPLMA